jgi:hypothetical protein
MTYIDLQNPEIIKKIMERFAKKANAFRKKNKPKALHYSNQVTKLFEIKRNIQKKENQK